MSGSVARTGFLFQDLYLLARILRTASNSLDLAWRTSAPEVVDSLKHLQVRFGLEASSSVGESLDWDVLVVTGNKFEFAEVKSGLVSKEHRIAFWRRLRRELTSNDKRGIELVPVLVVDPQKAESLTKWNELAATAASSSAKEPVPEFNANVSTSAELLAEALWFLCRPDRTSNSSDPAADVSTALTALTRFELHRHVADQLDSEVAQLLELLFPNGLTETEKTLLLGWLNQRATSKNSKRRLFTIRELLAEIGILENAISLAPGTLRTWRELWNEAPQSFRARSRLILGRHGKSIPAVQSQPIALNTLSGTEKRCFIILGQGGSGKSAFLSQVADAADKHGDEVLVCGADDINGKELEQLANAIRFRAALALALGPSSTLLVCIDGLDESDGPLRKRWAQILIRLSALTNVKIVASIRDAVWRADGEVRKQLESWQHVSIQLWPEQLVRDLLASVSFETVLPPSVIELLRTPILLDLFWRTFVDAQNNDVSRMSRLQTRHSLLAAFWTERLINSPRYSVSDMPTRLNMVISRAALRIGAFEERELDEIGVQALLSESVLVREGRLQPRLRFRHPLLRDFAIGQWCLSSPDASEVARRWSSIQWGLQRHGSLRAVVEALSDPQSATEYPQLNLGDVVQAILKAAPMFADQVAYIIGARPATAVLDPAQWPSTVQLSLPREFARDLLAAARLEVNGSWASRVIHWPPSATWFNKDYPKEMLQYTETLRGAGKGATNDLILQERCRHAARKVREISEAPDFASEFDASDRWLKMQAMRTVIPILTDEVTLAWVEREMTSSSWRTRSFLLELLIHLAAVDSLRAAAIYRQAVGLTIKDGKPELETTTWLGNMDHQAIEWSLAGDDGKCSLLKEFPVAFFPVALDLAEALWILRSDSRNNASNRMGELLRELDSPEIRISRERREQERQILLKDLIDDAPEWQFWRGTPTGEPFERCLNAIHECAEHCAKSDSAGFVSIIAPILQKSRLASIHSIAIDLLLETKNLASAQDCLRVSVTDARLFYVPGLKYWLEQAVLVVWPRLRAHERLPLIELLRNLLVDPERQDEGRRFLARLPLEDIPTDLRFHRPADGDPQYQLLSRPSRLDWSYSDGKWETVGGDDDDVQEGEWPEIFDRDVLKQLARAERALTKEKSPPDSVEKNIGLALEAASRLFPELTTHSDLLEDPTRFWVWSALTQTLNRFRELPDWKESSSVPPREFLQNCCSIAFKVVENIPSTLPGTLPERDVWSGYRDSGWGHSLRLLDAALTWPPLASDEETQGRFERLLEAAFATGDPMIQLVCTVIVRPFHWLRDKKRRDLQDRLVWSAPKHASVLAWSLSRTQRLPDADKTRIFRLLLNRRDLIDSQQLADSLGRMIGGISMWVFNDGKRSSVAELAREIVDAKGMFPLLGDIKIRNEFFGSFVFGMKEQAKHSANHAELASDYADWALKIWQLLRLNRRKRNESEGVVLLTSHWLGKRDEFGRNRDLLTLWWKALVPLLDAVAREGGTSDCFTLLFQLHSGEYNDLTSPEELMRIIEVFYNRISTCAVNGTINLDEVASANEDYHSWRECAEYAATTIDSLRCDGSLQTELQRETAHHLLSQLAAEPIRASNAIDAIHRLQSE